MSIVEREAPQTQKSACWSDAIVTAEPGERARLMGVFPGEGVGPEVVAAALRVLDAVEARFALGIKRVTGGAIGMTARGAVDGSLTGDIEHSCREIFEKRGVLFCGPGGGRFVYDLRNRFGLFCKLVPIAASPALLDASPVRPEVAHGTHMLIVRDNDGGIYQGKWSHRHLPGGEVIAEHSFSYTRSQAEQIIAVAVRLAAARRGRLHVIVKDGGVPAITALWREVALELASGVELLFLNVDHAAYRMIQEPRLFDVIVAPNMIGDILADLAAVFLGSRGLSFSGNFAADGAAVYQTGHGAAYDLAGTGRANPVAQILSLAMMLRESFAAPRAADLVENAIEHTWRQGWRTDDLFRGRGGEKRIGLSDLTDRIAQAVATIPEAPARSTAE